MVWVGQGCEACVFGTHGFGRPHLSSQTRRGGELGGGGGLGCEVCVCVCVCWRSEN